MNMFDINTIPGTEGLFDFLSSTKKSSKTIDPKIADLLEKASVKAMNQTLKNANSNGGIKTTLANGIISKVKRLHAGYMTHNNLGIILSSYDPDNLKDNVVEDPDNKGIFYLCTNQEDKYIGPFKSLNDAQTYVHNIGLKYALIFEQCMQSEIDKIPELNGIQIGVKSYIGKSTAFADRNEQHQLSNDYDLNYYAAIKSGLGVESQYSINDIGFDLSF